MLPAGGSRGECWSLCIHPTMSDKTSCQTQHTEVHILQQMGIGEPVLPELANRTCDRRIDFLVDETNSRSPVEDGARSDCSLGFILIHAL